METIGIIAEYNPFHNGHLYQINKIKEKYPESIIIVALNGYFLQRGEISYLKKEDKAKIALDNNVDIVIEIPVLFGSQSADIFSNTAIKLLNEFNIDKLIFGSESNNIELLEKIAKKQINNDINIKKFLKDGDNYPTALRKAINIEFDYNNPNDLLGISYIKTIISNNYNIEYECIKRTNDYHDICSNNKIISASNIRKKYDNKFDITPYVPFKLEEYNLYNDKNKLFELLKYKIITSNNLNDILSVDEGIENKLRKEIIKSNSLEELINNIKTKRYTYNRINRMFIHILLDILKKDNTFNIDYIKILGFNNIGQKYINSIKKNFNIPLYKSNINSKMKTYELKASQLYDLLFNTNTYSFELNNKPIKK